MTDRAGPPWPRLQMPAGRSRAGGRSFSWGDAPANADCHGRAADIVKHENARWAQIIYQAVFLGFGVTISSTSDGGAVSLTILADGHVNKKYAADPEALTSLLDQLQERFAGMMGGATGSDR